VARPAIFRNLGVKLLALAIALVVWWVFSAQRRERISERSYRIALSVVNVPAHTMIASPMPSAVDVRVRGPFTALRQLDPDKLETVVDLSDAPKGEKLYRLQPEDVNVPPEVEVVSISPAELRVLLDATAEKTLPVLANVTGKPATGWEVADIASEPRTATVYGPASALAKMTSVTTDPISIEQRTGNLSVAATVLADAPGVRVRQGQIVTVVVRLRAASELQMPTPTAPPRGKREGK
jgi:YbbR domain-containing protein